ncbi:MAG: hypothetical protein QME51_11805, partial [Planctomycetota bacterium]|nr:hypothetical protein [Planctomycetota bacterium]
MKDKCKKYGLAITDYVLGEAMALSYDELFNHLRECKKCREDLYDWQNTYAAMRTKEYFSRPETKKKMADMIANVKKQVFGAETPLAKIKELPVMDTKSIVGTAAGQIYNCLKGNGPMPIPVLKVK